MDFSQRLKELRQSKKVRQKDLAELFNITPRTWRFYEAGKREPNIASLIKIADYFGISIDFLVGRTDNPQINK
ncbi:helix-turn-helix domain-containing protein [Sporomusa acidovorans]|uniref:helix-turn-helix domain-containing protein n=1 Tax=Sporomusa acidovorans TaxID=112900 RepID=UPI000887C867|nr:helix-turn-helix transcriptional regulator [Sporomusa acidovorans]OZC14785.1 HTH-type transcriptional regulator ImmR [Sporomusa acidovorans DSM 3132]SDF71222.1 Helix-turn-helix [Sporomusa acidovorans]